ncbi:MAG TPA: GDSL-type esterase/lipase family protein [Tepidisphaeraceae bacterium]|nr:GDSL-type esterase/lipase family protein [Tepidisphaeraceae bacterium]
MKKQLSRLALAALIGLSSAATFVRADEPRKTETPVKPAPQKDEPSVPSVKGNDEKSKAGYIKRHEGFMKDKEELLKKGPIQLVFLGDSITDGWRGQKGKAVFDEYYGKYNAFNTGIGGDRTQHVLWRIENGELDGINPKVAEVMIGTNNLGPNKSNEAIAAGITKIVEEIHQKLPHTKVLLLGIFPRGNKAEDPARGRIKAINETISKLDDGGKTVKYLDIGDKFLDKDGTLPKTIMPDFLHPNDKGYKIWAEATQPTLDELMK